MSRHARVIINPQAGGKRTARRWRGVVRALREAGYTGVVGLEASAAGGAGLAAGDAALAAFRAAFEG